MPRYLYNGIEFPQLPEWDRERYPYAFIRITFAGTAIEQASLYFASTISYGDNGAGAWAIKWDDAICYYLKTKTGTEWTLSSDADNQTEVYGIVWTNTDILNSDGTLYLAASDPIPVVTAPTLDPLWLYMGWKAGNWVARQRGMRVEQPSTGIYDDTWPIEWNTLDVANNLRIPAETCQIYSYNGHEFGKPNIEPGYGDYHIIIKYDYGYKYLCLDQPLVYVKEDGEYAKTEGVYITTFICKTGEFSFGYHDDNIGPDNLKVLWGNVIWTNTDISDADGTVRMAATEPVYVREQVEV